MTVEMCWWANYWMSMAWKSRGSCWSRERAGDFCPHIWSTKSAWALLMSKVLLMYCLLSLQVYWAGLNHHLRLCHFLQQGFLSSKNSVTLLSLPSLTHLFGVLEGDGCAPGGQAAGDMCLRALSLCSADRDRVIWPTIMLPSTCCATSSVYWAGNTLATWLGGDPQGLGQIPTSLVGLGILGWVLLIAATQQSSQMMSHLCVSGPLPGNGSVFFLNPISRPALTDFCKRSQILAFVQNSV